MLKRVTFNQVDTVDEVVREFNKVIDNVNLMEAKICQLDDTVETLKPKKRRKKKGSVFMKTLILLAVAGAMFFSCICLGADQWPITHSTCSTPDQLVQLLRNRFSNQTGNYFTFDPTDTEPPSVDGRVYFHDTDNVLKLYTGSAWVNIDTAGGNTLDGAYDSGGAGSGRSITAHDGSVAISSTETDTNAIFTLTHSGAMATDQVMLITKSGAGDMPCIEFENTGGGADLEGTGATWTISKAGALVVVGATVGSGDLLFNEPTTNDITIRADTDNELEIAGTTEDVSINLATSDTLTWTTGTSVATVAWGDLDAHTGLTDITGDAATFTISITADAAGEDLVIKQAGNQNASILLDSDGTTAVDAIYLDSEGGIRMDAIDDIDLNLVTSTGGEDLTIDLTGAYDSSILIASSGTGSDAISLTTSAATGDIVINAGDVLNIDAATDIDIDVAGATGEDITLTNTGGSITLVATEAVTDCINIDATGGVDIDAGDDFALDVAGALGEDILITNTGGSITLSASEDVTDAINIDATAGGIDIDATGASGQDIVLTNTGGSILIAATESAVDSIKLQSTLGGIQIYCDASTNEDIDIINTGGAVHIKSTEASNDAIHLEATNAAGQIHIETADTTADSIFVETSGGLDINSAKDVTIDVATAGDDIRLDSALGSVYIEGKQAAADAVQLTATGTGGGIDIDALTGGITVDVTGAADIRMDSSGGSIDLIGAKAAADAIVIDAETDAGGGIDVDFGTGNLIVTGNTAGADMTIDCDLFSIDGTGSANISVTGTATGEDLTISQLGSAQNASVHVTSTGTGVDAISLKSSTGGIDIDAKDDLIIQLTTTTGDDDINISTTGSDDSHIIVTADGTSADALSLLTSGSGGGISMDTANGAIVISADNSTAGDVTVDAEDKLILVSADSDATDSVYIEASTGAGSGVRIHADAGTGVTDGSASVQLLSDVGGIGIKATASTSADAIIINAPTGGINMDAGEDIDIQVNSGATGEDLNLIQTGAQDAHVLISATGTSIDAIKLYSNGGTGAGIYLHNDAGNAVTDGAASIQLLSDDGGIGIKATAATSTDAIRLNAPAGGINVTCVEDLAFTLTSAGANDDMLFTQAGTTPDAHITFALNGTSADAFGVQASAGGIDIDASTDTIHIQNAADGDTDDITIRMTGAHNSSIILENTQGTGTDAISLQATEGGVDIDAKADADITLNGGQILIASEHDTASAISLVANTGTSETIVITNTQGDTANAITITATAGGINMDGKNDDDIAINAGQILIESEQNVASAVSLITNTGTSETIVVTNTLGQNDAAINVDATAGGVDVDAAKSIALTSSEATADAIEIVASDTVGGITLTAGTGGVTITGNVNRTSQQYVQSVAYAKLGASGAGWTLGAADSVSLATLAASQTDENIVIPITIPLKVGWTITGYTINGQIDSAGNTATLDADLRKHTEATAGYADATVDGTGTMTTLTKTADYKVVDGKSSLTEVVAADESYYLLVEGTTAATTDIEIASITLTVTEI